MDNNRLITFYNGVDRLKRIIRRGWANHGITSPESVADHVFGVTSLALLIGSERNLDIAKLVTMALIHEACEIKLGDITPHDGIAENDKQKMEEDAAYEFLSQIDESGMLFELWKDFEYQRSPEGMLIKDIDRLEMLLQARCYEGESIKPLDEFYPYVQQRIQDPELSALVEKLVSERNESSKANCP